MAWILLSLFAGAIAAPVLYRGTGRFAGTILSLLPLGIIGWSTRYWKAVAAGDSYRETYLWAPSLGVNGTFSLDALALVFLLLICGIGALVLIYAGEYLRKDQRLGLFYAYLLLFMASMLGVVFADNIYLLFVFWELTGISSYLLIGWNHETVESREAARTALFVTNGGGMMLLAGLVLLALVSGTNNLSELDGEAVRSSPLYLLTLALVLGGAFTKSAQFPFHFWLPGAMAAPTPVSAYLHSATMVKAGVYLLARLHPTLGFTDTWFAVVTSVGGLTMLAGAGIAFTQTDLKRILAYSTVSVLGTLTMLLGIGTREAISAAMVYLVCHSLYKGALFLIAGVLDHEAGSRDITQLKGLAKSMPLTAAAAVLAAASMAGLPPLFGFIAKELLYEAAWHAPVAALVVLVAAFVASGLMVAVALMVAYRPFFGDRVLAPRTPHEAPWRLYLGPVSLAVAGLLAGLNPRLVNGLLEATAAIAFGEPVPLDLALWHGLTPVLGLSVLTLLIGGAVFLSLRNLPQRLRDVPLKVISFQSLYDRGFSAVMRFADVLTRIVQNGYLRNYVLIVVITLLAVLGPPVFRGQNLFLNGLAETRLPEVVLAGVILSAALAVTVINSRLAAAAFLGIIGMAVMLLYIVFGALDLAVTQIMVETLTVIVLVLVLYHLPRFVLDSSRWFYLRDGVISLCFGGMIAILVMEAFAVQGDPELPQFFAANAYLEAYGRNVVNVILVDFRATDTMGEVTVLTAAAVGVYALLRVHATPRASGPAMISLVLRAAAPILILLLLMVSLYALLRGHHESGGGFIGGLLGAAAFSLHALAYDVPTTRRLLGAPPQVIMGLGLTLVASAGVLGLALGTSFLQGHWTEVFLPGLGNVHLGTPLLFDVGVYAVVMGMVLTIVLTAAEE